MGFRREYGLDWRAARATMWHVDLGMLVEGLDAWSRTDENIARLVDREDYWLNTEYKGLVTDPDDPEVKRAREERRRSGEKPLPFPVLAPVAQRPPEVNAEIIESLFAQVERHKHEPQHKKVSVAEFMRMRDAQ